MKSQLRKRMPLLVNISTGCGCSIPDCTADRGGDDRPAGVDLGSGARPTPGVAVCRRRPAAAE
jgi:hypothetical protein